MDGNTDPNPIDGQDINPKTIGNDEPVESVHTNRQRITRTTDITINVPSDEPTLPDAMDRATEHVQPRGDVNVVINIEAGHSIQKRTNINDGDYGYIRIESEDATVGVDSELTSEIFRGFNVRAPYWDILVDAQGNGGRGIELQNSIMEVANDKGIRNAGGHGIRASSSLLRAIGADFSGAAGDGIRVTAASTAMVQNADVSGALVSNPSHSEAALYVSRGSAVNAENIDASGSGGTGIEIRRSIVYCGAVDASQAAGAGLLSNVSSVVQAGGITATGCGKQGVMCRRNATVNVMNGDLSGAADHCIRAQQGGTIYAENATANDAGRRALHAVHATLIAPDANIDNPTDEAIGAFSGSRVDVQGSAITTLSDDAIHVLRGTIVNAHNATVDGAAIDTGDVTVGSFNSVSSDGIVFN